MSSESGVKTAASRAINFKFKISNLKFGESTMAEKTVGKPIKRTEDPRLIQGLAHYVDDIRLPDTLHAVFLRSIYPHARIKSIDTTAALKLPGVVSVYTGKDVQKIGPVPCAAALPELKVPD